MNILFISTEIPYPPDHGHHIRTYTVLQYFASKYNVYFIGFAKNNDALHYKRHIEQLCKKVEVFSLRGRGDGVFFILSLLMNLFSLLIHILYKLTAA